MIPDPWVAVVLVLATFRLARLIGWDDLPPVVKLRAQATGQLPVQYENSRSGPPIIKYRRPVLAHFLGCAYCQGFWVGLLVYAFWVAAGAPGAAAAESWLFYPLAPLALSGAVGITARMLDP